MRFSRIRVHASSFWTLERFLPHVFADERGEQRTGGILGNGGAPSSVAGISSSSGLCKQATDTVYRVGGGWVERGRADLGGLGKE